MTVDTLIASGATLTITDAVGANAITIDGSAETNGTFSLTLSTTGGNNIVARGGALADTISVTNTGAGTSTMTGGGGNDALTLATDVTDVVATIGFVVGAAATLAAVSTANGLDTINGFSAQKADNSAEDVLNFAAISAVTAGTTADLSNATVTTLAAALTAGDNVLILDDAAPFLVADATALIALTTAFTNVTSGNLIVAYAATANGDARIALVTLTGGDITDAVDLAVLVGVDVDNLLVGNFTLA